jgi:HEAT repeat protein
MIGVIMDRISGKINSLIKDLGDSNGLTRYHTRLTLVDIGEPAVPELIEALSSPQSIVRWEACKTLEKIGDPRAAQALVTILKDPDPDLRWAAAEALAVIGRASLEPVLVALTRDFGSIWLRTASHHILHTLDRQGLLSEGEKRVLTSLRETAPEIVAPWAAQAVLEEKLRREALEKKKQVPIT